ncbi:MAG: metallophosphoesterase [Bdellovibrionales bacterium]
MSLVDNVPLTEDFKSTNFTAVISDLHLCEAHITDPTNPLWKKFKTKQFFFDDIFQDFLEDISRDAKIKSDELRIDPSIELVLNGDIFDFDSVTKLPDSPPYKMSWLERNRGLHPEEPKSVFKIRCILEDHDVFVEALREFIIAGNKLVIVVGNHDVELLYPGVQSEILKFLNLSMEEKTRVRFTPWFYISNEDTLIEHGHQYDPYCICQNPIHPMVRQFNRVELRLPFGNLASRYMINGMGFFNPHVDANFVMSAKEYLNFFVKYMLRAQPLLLVTWFWSATLTFIKAFGDSLLPALKDPLTTEDRISKIAKLSNATPRMVRELNEIKVHPAASNPFKLARELWIDRAFLILVAFLVFFQIFGFIKLIWDISIFWIFIPLALFVPFFMFYTNTFKSSVASYKEPNEKLISLSSIITKTNRIIYGHTHIIRHEFIEMVEHLNPGTWSTAFLDVECTKPYSKRMYCWIEQTESGIRKSSLRSAEKMDDSKENVFSKS